MAPVVVSRPGPLVFTDEAAAASTTSLGSLSPRQRFASTFTRLRRQSFHRRGYSTSEVPPADQPPHTRPQEAKRFSLPASMVGRKRGRVSLDETTRPADLRPLLYVDEPTALPYLASMQPRSPIASALRRPTLRSVTTDAAQTQRRTSRANTHGALIDGRPQSTSCRVRLPSGCLFILAVTAPAYRQPSRPRSGQPPLRRLGSGAASWTPSSDSGATPPRPGQRPPCARWT
jgi:hypothetical protein